MSPIPKAPLLILLGLGTLVTVSAVVNTPDPQERNYRVIIDRNPFGLKPPPPPPTNPPTLTQPKDEVLLTGITSFGGLKAYFQTKAPQGKSADYYTLGVDEKKNGLEVLEINLKEKSVRVRNSGVEKVMTFAADGVKAPASASVPAGTPGAPGTAGATAPPPLPGAMQNAAHTGGGAPTMPGMTPTTPTTGPGGRVRTIPSRNIRTPAVTPNLGGGLEQPRVQEGSRPDPNAGAQDLLMLELQKRANPAVEFPPTPLPQ